MMRKLTEQQLNVKWITPSSSVTIDEPGEWMEKYFKLQQIKLRPYKIDKLINNILIK